MPDGDKFERRLASLWRKCYRLAQSEQETISSELTDAIITAIAATLRTNFYCSSLKQIIEEVEKFIRFTTKDFLHKEFLEAEYSFLLIRTQFLINSEKK